MAFHEIDGTAAGDRIDGTLRRDLILGAAGNDTLVGWVGNDKIYGQTGDDSVFGQTGNDTLFGGLGSDVLQSDDYDQGFSDHMYGGAGNDSIFADDKTDYSYGGAGDDQVTIYFDVGGTASGGAGRDTLVMNYIGSSLNTAGVDYDVSVTLRGPDAGATAGPDSMTLSGFEVLHITTDSGNDTVQGGAFDDVIDVYTGANTVRALGGNDLVSYHAGAVNHLDGGAGQDTLYAIAWEQTEAYTLTVTGTDAVEGDGSVITGFEHWRINGSYFDDVVQLGDGHDWFRGRGGDDAAQGMGGVDRLLGDRGADSLDGGAGADVLHGGRDLDLLTGGAGADSFVFGRVYAAGDVITDMTSGQDHIVLGARILGFALAAGVVDDSHFHLDLAEGTAGQFVYRAGQLIWDSNGTDADGEILIATLTGAPVLVAGDLTVIG